MTAQEIAATCHAAWEMVGRVSADIWRARRELNEARKIRGPGATAGHLERAEIALSVAAIELKSVLGQVAAARAVVAAALAEIDGLAPDAPPRPPISPIDCKHYGSILIQSLSGGPPHRSHGITVCPRCGRFTVSGDDEGHRFRVEFELATPEAVRAAGRYCHYLSLEG